MVDNLGGALLYNLRRGLFIYFRLLSVHVKAMIEYKADFYLVLCTGVLSQIVGLIFIWTLFQKIPSIAGWTSWEIAFMYSMIFVVEGILSLFFDGIWNFPDFINQGTLDRVLVRPISPIIQIVTSGFGVSGIGNFVLGACICVISLQKLHVDWSISKVTILALFLIFAVTIRVSINLSAGSSSFWTKSGNPILIVAMSLSEFAKYPITIYWWGVRAILIIIPYSFISFFPAVYLFKKYEWAEIGLMTPIVAVYCVLVTRWFFNIGLRRYEGVGN